MKKTKLKMGVVFSNEKPQKNIENKSEPKPKHPSASVLLEVAKDEYAKERERTNALDNKAGIFISAIIAMVTIFIPIIPFDKFISVYTSGSTVRIALLSVIVCVFALAAGYLIVAFYNLYTAFKLKPFSRVRVDCLNDIGILKSDPNETQKGLVDHYCEIIESNQKTNDKKANNVNSGLKYSIIGFSLLALSTVSLIIITNIGG